MFSPLVLAATIKNIPNSVTNPNSTTLPGGVISGEFLGGIVFYGTLLTIAGFIISAGFWAVGSFSGNYTQSVNGKKGFMCCAVAALVIGGAYALTAFFYNRGVGL